MPLVLSRYKGQEYQSQVRIENEKHSENLIMINWFRNGKPVYERVALGDGVSKTSQVSSLLQITRRKTWCLISTIILGSFIIIALGLSGLRGETTNGTNHGNEEQAKSQAEPEDDSERHENSLEFLDTELLDDKSGSSEYNAIGSQATFDGKRFGDESNQLNHDVDSEGDSTMHEDKNNFTNGKSLQKPRKFTWWFMRDRPGIDASVGLVDRIWNHEISPEINNKRTLYQRRHPAFAFIKGVKVGGTSVAIALDKAAKAYGIKFQSPISENENREIVESREVTCITDGSLWLHHGFRQDWHRKCIPHVRFLTMLRDPLLQALSWESMVLNHDYYRQYPTKRCSVSRHIPVDSGESEKALMKRLLNVEHCYDVAYRKNITLQLVAHAIDKWPSGKEQNNDTGYPGAAVAVTYNWIMGERLGRKSIDAKALLAVLRERFFLVGVADYLNEFLVLLAIHMGWSIQSVFYVKCKESNLNIGRDEFAKHFPKQFAKMSTAVQPYKEIYIQMKQEFEEHISRLGPWFKALVAQFIAGLKAYQAAHESAIKFKWNFYRYVDGHMEDC